MVSINIPYYNGKDLTERCVKCIKMFTEYPYELVMIDDGSTDRESIEYGKSVADTYIRHPENEGGAKARHDGVLASKGEYICIFDNDLVVTPGWLSKLVSTFEKFRENKEFRIFILSPIHTHRLGQFMINSHWYIKEDDIIPVEEVGASCMFFESCLIETIGNFDPQLFNLWSDLDFCRRVTRLDVINGCKAKVAVDPKVCVYHPGWIDPRTSVMKQKRSTRFLPELCTGKNELKMLKSMELIKERWDIEHPNLKSLKESLSERGVL